MGYNCYNNMKKITLFALTFVMALGMMSCSNNETPSTTSTKLWPAFNSTAGLYGYINKKGAWAIPAQFSSASSFFSAGYAIVSVNGKSAFIDISGKIQNCVSFDSAGPFYYGYSKAELNRNYGLIGTNFDFAIQPVYNSELSNMTNDGLVTFNAAGGKYGFLDKNGNVLMKDGMPVFYESADEFRDGYCVVCANLSTEEGRIPTYTLIDTNGEVIISEGRYMRMKNLGLGIVAVVDKSKDDKYPYDWRLIKAKDGSEFAGRIYNYVEPFSVDQVAAVCNVEDSKSKWGYIDADGKEIVPVTYDKAKNSTDGYAWVFDDKEWKLIDVKKGVVVYTLEMQGNDRSEFPLCGVHNGLTLIKKQYYSSDEGTSSSYRWIDVTDNNRIVFSWSYDKDKGRGDLDPSQSQWVSARRDGGFEFSEYVFLQ